MHRSKRCPLLHFTFRPIPPLIKAFQQGVPSWRFQVEGLLEIHLDPVDADGVVRELEPAVLEELVQPILVIDGQVKTRAIAKKLLLEVPFILVLDEAAGPPFSSTAMFSTTVRIQP